MNQFNPDHCLDKLLAKNKAFFFENNLLFTLATRLASAHQLALYAPKKANSGTPEKLLQDVEAKFIIMIPGIKSKNDINSLDTLNNLKIHLVNEYQLLKPLFEERKEQNFFRACHGDVHLDNIVLIDGKPLIFDCIEFNDEFRFIDTMADFSFLLVDLHCYIGQAGAFQCLKHYIDARHDESGLKVLPFYAVHRAIVLSMKALSLNDDRYKDYIRFAAYYADQKNLQTVLSLPTSQSQLLMRHSAIYTQTGKEKPTFPEQGNKENSSQPHHKIPSKL